MRRRALNALPRFALSACLGALAVAVGTAASAKVYLDINAPGLRRIPLAVPALKGEGAAGQLPAEIADVLRASLGVAELFEVLSPAGFLEDSARAPVHPDAGAYADWHAVGAEVLIKGQATRTGDSLAVDLWAHDVLRRQPLFGRHYEAPASEARAIAHMFANTVLEEFTGIAGPFGTKIAYVVQAGKAKELALVDMDGQGPLRLTRAGSLALNPGWSRDGRYLYYTSYLLGDPDLYLLDLATWKNWVVSRRKGIDLAGRDSPDGKDLLLVLSDEGNAEIYRMDKATRKTVRLTQNPGIDVAPTWSPDGQRIAFVSDRLGNPHLFVMGRDGGEVRRLTVAGRHNGDPEWSPRGDVIAFSGQDERGVFQVYTVDPEGRQVKQITFGPKDTYDPTWSPDGRFLAVTSMREGQSAVYVVRLGSSEFRRVSPAGEVAAQPSWSPRFGAP